jgi:hypothetical protein
MTKRPETSYETSVAQFKYLWTVSIHEGIGKWLDRLIEDAEQMRANFSKGDERQWIVDPRLFDMERALSHVRSGFIELDNVRCGDQYLSVARVRAQKRAELEAARRAPPETKAPAKAAAARKSPARSPKGK